MRLLTNLQWQIPLRSPVSVLASPLLLLPASALLALPLVSPLLHHPFRMPIAIVRLYGVMPLSNTSYSYNLRPSILAKWLIFRVNNMVLCVIAILAMNASLNSISSPFLSKSAKISPANFDAASLI